MILHLIPVSESGDPLEGLQEDIMVLPHEQQPTIPSLQEWTADQKDQTITHMATGFRFHAFSLKPPLVGGLKLPFHKSYEIAVRLIDIPDEASIPSRERVREIGRQGVVWIKTYTYESYRR